MRAARYISFSPVVGQFPQLARKGNPMVAALVNQLIAVGLGCSACSVAEPNPVPSKTPAIQASAPAVSDSACRGLDVALGNAGSLTVGFPNRATCGSGLTLISGGAPSWSQAAIIRVRVLNRGAAPIQLPVRVLLAQSGVQIIGAGTPSNITAVTPDSTLGGGVALWRTGGSGQLAPGDSTVVDTVKIGFAPPARHAKLTFGLDAMTLTVSPVPAMAPDTVPAWVYDDSSYTRSGSGFLRRTLTVLFKATATQAERQAAVDRISGVVVGGRALPPEDGPYLVKVPWDPTEQQLDSLATVLEGLPQVEAAGLSRRVPLSGRRPDDGANWAPADWTFQPDSASGENWALEEVAAPLAWGCSVGDPLTKIAVLDHAFDSTEIKSNVIARTLPYGFPAPNAVAADGSAAPRRRLYARHPRARCGCRPIEGDSGQGRKVRRLAMHIGRATSLSQPLGPRVRRPRRGSPAGAAGGLFCGMESRRFPGLARRLGLTAAASVAAGAPVCLP